MALCHNSCFASGFFPSPLQCVSAHRKPSEEHTKVCLIQEHDFHGWPSVLCSVCSPFWFLLCVCGLHKPLLLTPQVMSAPPPLTLYSWTTPFCSSSGGGCQETTMAVPLSPVSVTVTSRGGALGADGSGGKTTKKITHLHT